MARSGSYCAAHATRYQAVPASWMPFTKADVHGYEHHLQGLWRERVPRSTTLRLCACCCTQSGIASSRFGCGAI